MSTARASTQPWRKLKAITAGIATSRPKAVVTSASAMPADTVPRPPEPDCAIDWKELTMPITVPSRPTKGAVEPTVASTPEAALEALHLARRLALERPGHRLERQRRGSSAPS